MNKEAAILFGYVLLGVLVVWLLSCYPDVLSIGFQEVANVRGNKKCITKKQQCIIRPQQCDLAKGIYFNQVAKK